MVVESVGPARVVGALQEGRSKIQGAPEAYVMLHPESCLSHYFPFNGVLAEAIRAQGTQSKASWLLAKLSFLKD